MEGSEGGEGGEGWVQACAGVAETEWSVRGLAAGTAYRARVRAANTRGASGWRSCVFCTKLWPVEGGGHGPLEPHRCVAEGASYRWAQSEAGAEVTVWLPLPPGTRAREVGVAIRGGGGGGSSGGGDGDTWLEVTLGGESLLKGALGGAVARDELEWTLEDAPRAGGAGEPSRTLVVALLKAAPPHAAEPPIWASLLRSHPEIDVAPLRRAAAEARAGELNDPEVVAQLKSKLAQLAGGA
mmetsp:Transcript_20306/g.67081  ORF Transcript_20306/g.67081 Transcript_20306/m.67081 type:complete len:240 (+) Transcript_20306:2-721(+)